MNAYRKGGCLYEGFRERFRKESSSLQDLVLRKNATTFERSALHEFQFHSVSRIAKRGDPYTQKNRMNV